AEPELDQVCGAGDADRGAVDATFVIHAIDLRDRVFLLFAVPLESGGGEVPREWAHTELVARVEQRLVVAALLRGVELAEEAREALVRERARRDRVLGGRCAVGL